MDRLKLRICDEVNGLDYVLAGDYYIPAIELPEDENRPVGKWGRIHRAYLEETNPLLFNHLIFTGKLHTYLAELNEQAKERYRVLIQQMAAAEGVTEDLKRWSQWEWVRAMNSIVDRAEENIKCEFTHDRHPGSCADRKPQRPLEDSPYDPFKGRLLYLCAVIDCMFYSPLKKL